jgi:hypothetical protein
MRPETQACLDARILSDQREGLNGRKSPNSVVAAETLTMPD